jgi:hypothetical protein
MFEIYNPNVYFMYFYTLDFCNLEACKIAELIKLKDSDEKYFLHIRII